MNENDIGDMIIDTAVTMHIELGPGLFESVYEAILFDQLSKKGLIVKRQVPVPIVFDGKLFDEGFRLDLLVEEKVIVELKSIEKIAPVHKKQLITYLRLSNKKLGYILNFRAEVMKDGITRIVNKL